MIRILGIDPGTRCGWALYQKGGTFSTMASGVWNLSGEDGEGAGLRFLRLRNYIEATLRISAPKEGTDVSFLVAYEDVRRHLGTQAAHVYGGIVAIVTSACEAAHVAYQGVPVGTVKKYATGSGNASKAQMVAAANKAWPGVRLSDHNEADARFIALTAAASPGYPFLSSLKS